MNTKTLLTSLLLSLMLATVSSAQDGIRFFTGTFDEALAKAKAEDKALFVDFFATWCGPCKRIAREVFPQKEVGDYFNTHFISIQLDAEAPQNVEIAKKYAVQAYPTLIFMSNEGKAISVTTGGVDVASLLDAAKTATGEMIGFAKLYEMYQHDKDNLDLKQNLLLQAPSFLATQEGMDADRWVVRLRKLYREYITQKIGPQLINRQDYRIISTMGGDDPSLQKQIIDYMVTTLPEWISAVGDPVAYYIIEYNDARMEELAKKGDTAYRDLLEKINSEYKAAYDVAPDTGLSPYQKSKMYYDALYALYSNQDADEYINLMTQYFVALGEGLTPNDYAKSAQDLYHALGDKLQPKHHEAAIAWLTEALKGDNPLSDRINYLVMIGDSYKQLGKYDLAQQYYNQGFADSYQITDSDLLQQMIQATIIRKTSELELLRD